MFLKILIYLIIFCCFYIKIIKTRCQFSESSRVYLFLNQYEKSNEEIKLIVEKTFGVFNFKNTIIKEHK